MSIHPELLIAVILLPGAFGWLSAAYLRGPLIKLLTHECGTEDRAEVWARLTVLGMTLGPIALALMRAGGWGSQLALVEIVRALFSISLNGVLVVLGILAFAIWRRIPSSMPAGRHTS